jgi:arylsulfatase A-like enzyme
MTKGTAVFEEAVAARSAPRSRDGAQPGALAFLALALWCGLAAGLLEVGLTVLRKRTVDLNRLYWMSRHFIWLVPITNLLIFLVLGVLFWLLARRGRRGRWVAARLLCALALLPPIWAAFPRIYGPAGVLVAVGAAAQLVPALERHRMALARVVRLTLPVTIAIVAILAGSLFVRDRIREATEQSRPLPPSSAPSVLLVVLDTVAADHLSLYGFNRPTCPTLEELASRGIQFNHAQATSSWTLPSHASLFTGRWPHDLSAGWLTPLDRACPTLAEFLGASGYATAGFAANYLYCASDSGLGRGFATYKDFIFPRLSAFHMAVLVDRPLEGLQLVSRWLESRFDLDLLRPLVKPLWWLLKSDRKDAATVSREFLDWLSRRPQPERPFFAFLNDFDAHYPYEIPASGIHRFGVKPRNLHEADLIQDWSLLVGRGPSREQIDFVRGAYDDCIAHLDEQLGRLIDELGRRGVLDRTWLIVAADHGESFGEHPGVFCHGSSLYQTEVHVPLVIVPPGGLPARRVVDETVSLRDVAATIVDVLGFAAGHPFPGDSLARFWTGETGTATRDVANSAFAVSEVVPLDVLNPDPAQFLKPRWPLGAFAEGDWVYIRREGDVREELFNLREDPHELVNRAGAAGAQPIQTRMREALGSLTAGALVPARFRP